MSGDHNDVPPDEPRTVFAPKIPPLAPAEEVTQSPVLPPNDPTTVPASSANALREGAGRIQVGDVLNNIFEVRRFIARGGMGEVYQGINVNTDEPVAIKVMLPALAADPNVQAMFRKEAKTLTRLSHPALVQYRVLAQEPQLGVFYIVTDYIDGTNLSDVLGSVPKDAKSLTGLLRRLAEGLQAAHELGAVHRDISPDNVLLEGGQFDGAKIIDFGIAKDLDTAKETIIGDGFAGKLNYVAPEQLGDFGREVGAWTDVYSLALVILSVASGKNVNMGATLVDAVDKRRVGVDVSAAPEELRPVLEAMLRPNPRERPPTMAAVIAAINNVGNPAAAAAKPVPTQVKPAKAEALSASGSGQGNRRNLMIGGGIAAAVIVLAGIGALMMGGKGLSGNDGAAPTGAANTAAVSPDAAAAAAIASVLPSVGCSWLSVETLSANDGISVRFNGVAGDTAAAQASLSSAIAAKGLKVVSVDFEDVAPINTVACSMLDAYRAIKSQNDANLTTAQIKYEMQKGDDGKTQAIPQMQISPDLLAKNLALVGIESNGVMSIIVNSASALREAVSSNPAVGSINADGSLTLKTSITTSGWSGLMAISGDRPIDTSLIAPPPSQRGPDWQAKIAAAAKANGWKADMVWFKVVDEKPESAVPADPAAPGQPPAQ